MPPEHIEEIRIWLVKASRDLEAAQRLVDPDQPLLDVAVYHCQQAAEKALKGYLTYKESPFAKTHALVLLVEPAVELDGAFLSLIEHAEDLSPFAWRFRHPGDALEPGEEEARQAVDRAREVLHFVVDRLPDETRP